MVVTELEDGIAVRLVADPAEAEEWRAAFIGAYQTIFSGFPYFERWLPDEVDGVWHKLTGTPGHITLLATRGMTQVVGFCVGIPLAAKKDVARELTGLVPTPHTFYLAELGVLPEYRNREIGRTLVLERHRRIDRQRFTHVVLRVSSAHTPSSAMYRALGFQEVGVTMMVPAMRVDGRVTTDKRFFLSKVLSQVALD